MSFHRAPESIESTKSSVTYLSVCARKHEKVLIIIMLQMNTCLKISVNSVKHNGPITLGLALCALRLLRAHSLSCF